MDLRPAKVLDLGCGEGWLVRELSRRGVEACGVDASEPLIEAAAAEGGGRFVAAGYEDLLGRDELGHASFDVVVANFSILEDDVRLLMRGVAALLAPGGAFVIQTVHPLMATPGSEYVDGWRMETFSAIEGDWREPMPWFFRTIGGWIRILRDNGFTVDEVREPLDAERLRPLSILFTCRAGRS